MQVRKQQLELDMEQQFSSKVFYELLYLICFFLKNLVCQISKSIEQLPLATPWTAAYQAPPSMGFSSQEYWSRVPLSSPRILEWVAISYPRGSSQPRDRIHAYLLYWQVDSLQSEPPGKPKMEAAAAKLLQSCPTLCDPIDGSPPGSAVPGILQARTPEWVAISFSNAGK